MQKSHRHESRGPWCGAGVALLGVVLAAGAGCTTKTPQGARDARDAAVQVPDGKAMGAQRQDTATPTSGSVHIDERIMKACGDLPSAHFAFDSAAIRAEADTALDALARCFVSGPLKGHGMKLIGHADPRGEHEYNFALGQRRAGSVATYLSGKGLDAAHVQSSSKGDTEATGTDEAGWARDRVVDIFLAD
jgi:peptidoglycan-associated lipoprotein